MSYIGNQPYQVAFVSDSFSGTGSTTVFTMSVAPANTASVLIAVSGVLQDPSTYSVSGTTLTFTGAPPSGTANISARYLGIPASGVTTTAYRTVTVFTATAGQTTFTPPSYTAGFINVFRNGVLLTPTSDYTATNGTTVVLATGATSGDTVLIESFLVSSVLNAIPNTVGSVVTSNISNGAVGSTQLGNLTTLPVSGGYTATLPAATGTVMVSGNNPTFSAYNSSTTTSSAGAWTKIAFQSEEFDTNNCFDSTTNYRFTPNVAGYYQINGAVQNNSTTTVSLGIYKNGSLFKQGGYNANGGVYTLSNVSALIYMNGSTDYLEIYFITTLAGTTNPSAVSTYFQGSMVRSA